MLLALRVQQCSSLPAIHPCLQVTIMKHESDRNAHKDRETPKRAVSEEKKGLGKLCVHRALAQLACLANYHFW